MKLEENIGTVSNTIYFIDKETFYPIKIKGESYSIENIEQKSFISQRYFDIIFNLEIDENVMFNTSNEVINGFEIEEMKPQ